MGEGDALTFLTGFFETPALLLHLLLVAAMAALACLTVRRRRRLLKAWPGIVQLSDQQRTGWGWELALRVVGMTCLVIALAGPRFGSAREWTPTSGRDVMIVLDVSRSMNAEQPSRLEKGIRALRTLTVAKRLPAGTRVGLIVFAARPWLAFPLTDDVDHLASVLDALAAGAIPPEVRAGAEEHVSGTRLGAALKMAVESFPETDERPRDVVLVSDGDDPVADDEWRSGIAAARARGVPVTTVAVGEPDAKATIPYRDDVLRYDGEIVTTQVNCERLGEVSRRTDGQTLFLERGELPLADLLAKRSNAKPVVVKPSEATTPAVRRGPWLLAAFLALIAELGFLAPAWKRSLAKPAMMLVGLTLVAGEPAGLGGLQRGLEAFARQDYAAAIEQFDRVQPQLADPGIAAFNRAAARYRLGQFAEAAADYRSVLGDAAIPPERRQRAWYDLGNSLLHQAKNVDRRLLEEAIASYKECLKEASDEALRADAIHNSDLALRRLRKLLPNDTPPGTDPNPQAEPKDGKTPDKGKSGETSKTKVPDDRKGTGDPQPPEKNGGDSKTPALGSITVLQGPTTPAGALNAVIERIAQERRRALQARDFEPLHGKDW